jgi:NAD(P) transhydrogenase
MSERYDLCVIGSGPAGEKGAAQAAFYGKSVCLIERAPRPGGTAVNSGALPSKTLRETALLFHQLRQRGVTGVDWRVRPDASIGDFMRRERAVVDQAWHAIDENLARHQVTRIRGTARFVDAGTLDVIHPGEAPRRIAAERFLVATGSQPHRPAEIPFDGRVVLDVEEMLDRRTPPARLVVIGGGAAGCEFAATFAALGAKVSLVTDRPRLLAQLDADVADAVRNEMTRRLGIQTAAAVAVTDIRVTGDIATVTLGDGRILHAECVLYCAAREGRVAALDLAAAGIAVTPQGFIQVERTTFRTTNPGIVAAGDVCGFPALASLAMEQARVAVCQAFGLPFKTAVSPVVPTPIWTIPEVATVGLTEEAARTEGIRVERGLAYFRDNPRGQIVGELDGFVKLLFRTDDKQLIGASVMGEGAAELIHIPAAVIGLGGTIDYFIGAVFNYPAMADAFKYAAYDGLQRLALRVSAAMEARARSTPVDTPTVPPPDRG